MYLDNKGREWMIVVRCEERKLIKKKKYIYIYIWYFNEIYCKIDNLIWNVLKSEYIR